MSVEFCQSMCHREFDFCLYVDRLSLRTCNIFLFYILLNFSQELTGLYLSHLNETGLKKPKCTIPWLACSKWKRFQAPPSFRGLVFPSGSLMSWATSGHMSRKGITQQKWGRAAYGSVNRTASSNLPWSPQKNSACSHWSELRSTPWVIHSWKCYNYP